MIYPYLYVQLNPRLTKLIYATVLGDVDVVGGDLMASWFLLRPRPAVTELQPAPVQSTSLLPTKFRNNPNQKRPRSESGSREGLKSSRTFIIPMTIDYHHTKDFIHNQFLFLTSGLQAPIRSGMPDAEMKESRKSCFQECLKIGRPCPRFIP